jgi:hypothetical protein
MRCAVPRLGKGVVIWAVRSILGGGQYGHHNPFYHHRRHIVTSRRRLVWPRTVVLGSDSPCISPHVAARARVIHAALINPCQPSVAKRPTVRGWWHETDRAMRITVRKGTKKTARYIELYGSAYRLALKDISALQKREQPNIPLRLHASIRRQIKMGATEPLFIAVEALNDLRAAQTV